MVACSALLLLPLLLLLFQPCRNPVPDVVIALAPAAIPLFSAFFLMIQTSYAMQFTYNGFQRSDGFLFLQSSSFDNGKLSLTQVGVAADKGRALYPSPVHFKDGGKASGIASFSTTFIFLIQPGPEGLAQGMAFLIAPNDNPVENSSRGYLGVLNRSSNGNPSAHMFAVELDTYRNPEFRDMDDNHVGINLNSMTSVAAASPVALTSPAFLSSTDGTIVNLKSGQPNQIWISYDGDRTELNISISRKIGVKPPYPFFSNSSIDLSDILQDNMYVGFSASTANLTQIHNSVLAWSFSNEGLSSSDITHPISESRKIKTPLILIAFFSSLGIALCAMLGTVLGRRYWRRKRDEDRDVGVESDMPTTLPEVMADLSHNPQRFRYKELYRATDGFDDKNLLGRGAFGSVYRGVLANGAVIAVKRVSKESRQGMKEFIAEVTSIGRLRHRHLVPLLGWCQDKGLALVYELMSNGSLDMYLFDGKKTGVGKRKTGLILMWTARCKILQGVASALVYLHEEWEQKIIHRDVKASNVLLDAELNARLGDFGLARLHDHNAAMTVLTTDVAGTFGYLAPEYLLTRKFTEKVDVYSFGALLLEVATGRRITSEAVGMPLVDWLWKLQGSDSLLEAIDSRLLVGIDCEPEAWMETLRLGLLCLHPDFNSRPSMRRVLQVLTRDAPLPPMPTFRPSLVVSPMSSLAETHAESSSTRNQRDPQDYHQLL